MSPLFWWSNILLQLPIWFDLTIPAPTSGGHVIEYVINQKGFLQLQIDGYPFHRMKAINNKQYYNCARITNFG